MKEPNFLCVCTNRSEAHEILDKTEDTPEGKKYFLKCRKCGREKWSYFDYRIKDVDISRY